MAKDEKFDINALARQYGEHYKISQQEDEPNSAYRIRVAGELRQRGKVIEAHEAHSGKRYDDPNQGPMDPMTGIFGAVAQAMQGINYHPSNPERQIDDDLTVGIIVTPDSIKDKFDDF